jgi:hypothetical protein
LVATLAVAFIGDGKPPPTRVAAALATPMAPGGSTAASQSSLFITSYNQVTGERYVGIGRDGRGQVMLGPTGSGENRISPTGVTGAAPADYNKLWFG